MSKAMKGEREWDGDREREKGSEEGLHFCMEWENK